MTGVPRARARGRNRALLAIGILAAWSVGAGMLVRREYFRGHAALLAEAALRLAPGGWFYIVERDGRQIGFGSTSIDTTSTAFEVVDYVIADQPGSGRDASDVRASTRTVITLSRALALRTFDVQIDSADAPRNITGIAEGDSIIHAVLRTPGQPVDSQRIAVNGPVLLPTMIPVVALLTKEPKVGRRMTISSFDPATMTARDVRVRFEAESLFTLVDSAKFDEAQQLFVPALLDTVRAWKLVPESGADSAGFSWVDAQGRIVSATEPGGITIRRIAYEIAFENWRRGRGILEGSVIAAGVLPVRSGPSTVRVRLTGVSLGGFDLQGGRQQLDGDTLTIEREAAGVLDAGWSMRGNRGREFNERFGPLMGAEPLLQVNDREVVRLAVRIAGADRDPRVVAEKINRWVHDSLEKAVTANVPNASQVLRARRGDSGEHAQLFAALARASGIPTRIATGLVFVDGKFHYHAWPEIWLRDWVAVDPTLGQFPADAAHVRFVQGRVMRQGELLRLVGNLRLEVLLPDAR